MKKEEEQKNLLVIVLIALLDALTGLLTSCSSFGNYRPQRTYQLKPVTIILADYGEISDEYEMLTGYAGGAYGYAEMDKRCVHVKYSGRKDINGEELPDFHALGHEIWHMRELGGWFHK